EGLKKQNILFEQVRLLYESANVSVGVSVLAATILGALQWGTVRRSAVLWWWICVVIVAMSRYVLAIRYRRSPRSNTEIGEWRWAFTIGAGLAGIGWGVAGFLLYAEGQFTNQIFLIFVLGGMMLGAGFLLAPRIEAFLVFLIPTGLAPT